MNNSNTYVSMFPLPPNTPEGKDRNVVSYLQPVTDVHDKVIDRGIMDSAYFIHKPNETKKFASVRTDDYNFINMVDGIYVDGAKCYRNIWIEKLYKQIEIIHTEYYSVIGDRIQYNEIILEAPEEIPLERDQAIYLEQELEFISDTIIDDPFIIDQEASLVENTLIINHVPPMIDAALAYDYDQPCTPVEGITTAKLPPETRKWIHHLRYIHPKVDVKVKDLELYWSVSEHMGENVITYNSDTCSVDVFDWKLPTRTESNIINPECVFAYETPHHLREIIRERMHPEQPDELNKGWTELNRMMVRVLPSELTLTTEEGTGLWIQGVRDPKEPHGAILVNDYYHWKDRIDPIKIPVAHDLFAYLKDACQLVNHMYPLLNNVKAEHAEILHEPLVIKDIEQEWIIYKDQAPEGGDEIAPFDVIVELDRWGYAETDVMIFDWEIGVGLAVEETYPRKKLGSGTFQTDLLGTKTTGNMFAHIDNRVLTPDIIKVPIA